jgi:hypothetical protein
MVETKWWPVFGSITSTLHRADIEEEGRRQSV